ncbi:MAG: hypothetical protein M1821_004476 [Bathelium mastoideum]|nr:MAG: hypothetical protein M1821_004476 [Bathelium mastoideum]
MTSNLQPRVSIRQARLHASYDLPHRLNCAKAYPVSAPNGSQIIFYGHGTGLRIIWRGGRPLKKPSKSRSQHRVSPPAKVNGASQDVIVIDSDDEEPQQSSKKHKPHVEQAEFEQEEEEYDHTRPSPPIVQTYDIRFGSEVLEIALPPVPPCSPSQFPEHLPDYLSNNALIAVACADCSVRLVSIPLAPPSHSAKAEQYIGQQTLSIGGPLQHQENINCISLTWTKYESDDSEDDDEDMEAEGNVGRSQQPSWQFLIASHSAQYSGSLLIHKVPLLPDKDGGILAEERISTIRNQYLKCPLSSLAFSNSHIHLDAPVILLTLDRKESVRLYNPFVSPAAVTHPNSRRAVEDEPSGAWLTSFIPGFLATRPSSSSPDIAHKKRVIDTQWVLNSTAIISLLSGGELGIWYINNTLTSSGRTVMGAANAQLAISGYLPSAEDSETRTGAKTRGLTPATPNTRKTRTADFLTGSSGKTGIVRGGIRVMPLSTSDPESDERVLIWYDNQVYAIPSFKTYWQRHVPNQGGKTPVRGATLPKVEDLELQGERCNGVEHLPGTGIPPTGLPELLIVGEHRLTFVTKEPEASRPASSQALVPAARDVEMDDADQTLLEREELDLGGVNRLLDGMGGNAADQRPPRRVGFAH